MYNLSLPKLCATLLVDPLCLQGWGGNAPTLYCAMPYIIACVDVGRMISLGPFMSLLQRINLKSVVILGFSPN